MAFVVVYDSCVLYPNVVRDLLIRVAQAGMVQAKWTDRILDEMSRALREQRGTESEKLERLRGLMNDSVRDVRVTGYEPLIDAVKLPDPDDRIVYACINQIAESRRNPPETVDDIFNHMERSGLRRTVAALRLGPGSVAQMTGE